METAADKPANIGAGETPDKAAHAPRPRTLPVILAACAVLVVIGLLALGTWQVRRLQWKRDLIERVETRVHAAPVPAPARDRWPLVNAADDEYRHVRFSGTLLYRHTVPVQASTVLGSGFWLLTPLRSDSGEIVLVNRGFVASTAPNSMAGDQSARNQESGTVIVTGLLRISEPRGGFLRNNDPAAGRWYSRDVQAIAVAQGLGAGDVAPYFIDADARANPENEPSRRNAADDDAVRPVGGLTVVAFQNNHLVYAITWYALALMVAGFSLRAAREGRGGPRGDGLDE